MPFMFNLPDEIIRENFTHKGWLTFCPVYIGEHGDELLLCERNGIPEWMFFVAVEFSNALSLLRQLVDPEFPGGFLVKVTGEI